MPTTNVLDGRPRMASHLVFRPQIDRVLVYNSVTDQMYLLRPLAAELLKRCDGTRSAAELATDAFADDPLPAANRDEQIARFFGQLERRRLISWTALPAGTGDG